MKNNFEQFMSFFSDSGNLPASIADYLLKYGNKTDVKDFITKLLIIEQSALWVEYKFSTINNSPDTHDLLKLMVNSSERLKNHICGVSKGENTKEVSIKVNNTWLNGISLN